MRREQMSNSQILHSSNRSIPSSVNLINELKALRLRKDELESHMVMLRDNRKHLMDVSNAPFPVLNVLPFRNRAPLTAKLHFKLDMFQSSFELVSSKR